MVLGHTDFTTQSDALNIMATWIDQGLNGQAFMLLDITAEAKVGYGQEVYPLHLPHVRLSSISSGQAFILFVRRNVVQEQVRGEFNAYGLSPG